MIFYDFLLDLKIVFRLTLTRTLQKTKKHVEMLKQDKLVQTFKQSTYLNLSFLPHHVHLLLFNLLHSKSSFV